MEFKELSMTKYRILSQVAQQKETVLTDDKASLILRDKTLTNKWLR